MQGIYCASFFAWGWEARNWLGEKMNFRARALAIVAFVILIFLVMGGAYACSINVSSFQTEARGTGDYSTAITADRSTDIDIKISFTVDSYSGSDCPTNISAQSKIYRYNNDTSNWEYVKTTSSKSQELSNDTYVFVWNNEFNTTSTAKYTRYRIDGNILSGSTIVDTETAYVGVENNSCSGVTLVANNFTINEGATSTRTLRIENNTNKEFSISTLSVILNSPIIRSGNTSGYDNVVSSFSYEPVNLYLDAGFVSSNTTTTLKFQVAGYLGNNYCSISAIGTKNFDVTVQNTGTNDNYNDTYYDPYYDNYSTTSSACADINLSANNTTMDEATEGKPVINITNSSTKRFEILEVKTTNNGVDLSNYYNDKYVYPGQVSDIVLRAISPSVTSDKVYTNTVWVRGVFSDGRTCSFGLTGKTTIITTIVDASAIAATQNLPLNCTNFSISVPSSAQIKNYGAIPFTINNNTGKRADIYIEGTTGINTTPTLIPLPGSSSITRELAVNVNSANGQVTFRPVVDGCSLASKSVAITNTSTVVSAQGQNASNTVSGALAGLFALGNNAQGIGLVVLAIIIIIIIVGVIASNGPKGPNQAWVEKK